MLPPLSAAPQARGFYSFQLFKQNVRPAKTKLLGLARVLGCRGVVRWCAALVPRPLHHDLCPAAGALQVHTEAVSAVVEALFGGREEQVATIFSTGEPTVRKEHCLLQAGMAAVRPPGGCKHAVSTPAADPHCPLPSLFALCARVPPCSPGAAGDAGEDGLGEEVDPQVQALAQLGPA